MKSEKISYLGIEGSYAYQACQELRPGYEAVGFSRFADVFGAVETGVASCALVPVDNALEGRNEEIYRQLDGTSLKIIEEFILPIHHALMIPANLDRKNALGSVENPEVAFSKKEMAATLAGIREIYSHPQGFHQCRNFLEEFLPHAKHGEYGDTASAGREAGRIADRSVAAISSEICAGLYDLQIIQRNIADETGNATRFLLLAASPSKIQEPIFPAITTILFETKHEPGSLVAALSAFSANGVNLTKLETYMASRERRKPTFYVDIGEHFSSERMSRAIAEFDKHVEKWQMLGSYPASLQRGVVSGFLTI